MRSRVRIGPNAERHWRLPQPGVRLGVNPVVRIGPNAERHWRHVHFDRGVVSNVVSA